MQGKILPSVEETILGKRLSATDRVLFEEPSPDGRTAIPGTEAHTATYFRND